MLNKFTSVIHAAEAEIAAQYIPGAIRWIDETEDGAWSKAMDDLDQVVSAAVARHDYPTANLAIDIYRERILEFIRRYKKHRQMDDAAAFLTSVRAFSKGAK